uniref:Uncharacterized protein n=1 Tax=Meloidogyne enterolobii TaxID=390850 RepID=A0A6V7TYH3_MELEN|nr:unnamed protein product [Meloidogyne enterolobii]
MDKKYRFIAFDLETTQYLPSDKGKQHEANFIAAKVTCPDCILEEKECKVCGKHRLVTFSHQPFTKTTVDNIIISQHPLEAFVEWILHDLPQEYDTIAFSTLEGDLTWFWSLRNYFCEVLHLKC